MSKRNAQTFFLLSIAGAVLGICMLAMPKFASAQHTFSTPVPEKPDITRNQAGHSVVTGQAIADNYGYQIISTEAPVWKDATDGTLVEFTGRDDEFSDPIPIGFTFPFYEGSYTQLYANTNGTLNFGEASFSYENRDIPRDTTPNNYIAAFWDDLNLAVDGDTNEPISQVFYKTGTDAQGKYFVLEWNKITRVHTPDDSLTFEVILRENGDIIIQYNQLNGTLDEATVGIEDDRGVDGIAYNHNNPGLSTSTAVQFKRPGASAHSKIYPLYRGGFAYAGSADFWYTIRNNGASGADTYNLQLSSYPSSWRVTFYNESGGKLSDSDGDGKIDTGAIAHGAEARVRVMVEAPETAQIGDEIQVDLTVISSRDTSKTAIASFTTSIPTPFAQAVLSGGAMKLHMAWRENWISALAAPTQFTGSFLTVQRLPNGNYLYSWEQNSSSSDSHFITDLRYTILSDVGGVLLDVKYLTNNNAVSLDTEDRKLVSSVTGNGLIGTAWTRRETHYPDQGEPEYRYNIFFSVLDEHGNIVVPETNITQNTIWGYPYYLYPQITNTVDNRFVIAWTRDVASGDDSVDDIEYAVYANNGNLVKAPTIITNSELQVVSYKKPNLAAMAQNQVLLSYIVSEFQGIDTLAYVILDSNGDIIKTQTDIPGSNGADFQDSTRLGSGHILLAWPSVFTGQVAFCLFDGNNGDIDTSLGTQYLTPPNYRDPDSVSVAHDEEGRGIITWRDRSQAEYLYYALVDLDGTILTPAITFLESVTSGSTITTNGYGYGLASYEGSWQVTLPFSSR